VVITDNVHEVVRMAAKTSWMTNYAKLNDCTLHIRPWQNEHQQSVNDVCFCILGNLVCKSLHTADKWRIGSLYRQIGMHGSHCPLLKMSVNVASMDHQLYVAMHLGLPESQCLVIIHILCTGCLCSENSAGYLLYPIMTMSVNGASTIFGLVCQVNKMSFGSS